MVRVHRYRLVDVGDAFRKVIGERGKAMAGSAEHERLAAVSAKTTFDEVENLGTFSRLVNDPTLRTRLYVGACRQGVRRSKCRIECDRLQAVVQHGLNGIAREYVGQRQRTQVVVMGIEVFRPLSPLRSISASWIVVSRMPTTASVIWSCSLNRSSASPSYIFAAPWLPVAVSTSWR